MTEPETIAETAPGLPGAEIPEAPHSWDPAGRDVPAAKMDWLECLPFRQVRGMDVAFDRDRPYGLPGASGES